MSKDLFTQYYHKNTWSGKESLSGPGSDYEQTKYLIPEVEYLFDILKVKTVFDAPCGDFNWMKRVNLDKISYLGGDIVEPLIDKNNRKYKSKGKKFIVFDLVNDQVPAVDLVMVRDCLVHLPNEDVKKVLSNIKNSGSKYLLTTHFTWDTVKSNYDIKVGDWRRLNLLKPPFNFPFPKHIIVEGNIQSYDRDKTMSLWEIQDLPDWSTRG